MAPAHFPSPRTDPASGGAVASEDLEFAAYHGSRAIRILTPAGLQRPSPVVLLLPGGDFSNACIDAASGIGRTFAQRLGVAVVVPAYTAACECPFPAAVEDVYAALVWARGQAKARGWDAARLIVAGEEAGGNLAASAALMARDRGGPLLAAQILIAPMLDPSLSSGSMQVPTAAEGAHTQARCAEAYRRYLPHAADRLHPYAAPLQCRRLAGVAPALVLTATDDPLREEGASYASALIGAGVNTQVVRLATLHAAPCGWADATWSAIAAFLGPQLQTASTPPNFRHST